MRTTPPFRADQVGSLLRPAELHEARARSKAGAISGAQLKEVEDRCIRAALARQEALGLRVVTDGEFRRDFWHLDFLRQLEGVGLAPITGVKFDAEDVPPMPTVTGKVRCAGPIMVDHFQFLKSMAKAVPKLTIPAPAMLHLRGGRSAISREHYPDLAAFWTDAAAAYRAAIGHIAAAGCTYLQLDDVSFSYLCDPKIRESLRASGDDPATLPRAYAGAINGALAGRPAGMAVTMHTCRGNFRSTWLASSPYDDGVVEAMFSTDVDAYFMEWDSERAGGFEPLRLLPATRWSCWDSSPPSRARSSPKRRWRAASTRPRSTCRWTACASPRSAASPARTTATRSPRTSSGESWSAWWRCLATSGANRAPSGGGRARASPGRGARRRARGVGGPGARPPISIEQLGR